MAAGILTVAPVTRAGIDLTGTAATATDGDSFANTGKEYAVITNGSGAPITATLNFGTNGKVDGQTATPKTVSIAAGKSYVMGPFPTNLYNDANGRVTIVCSAVTTVTIKAITCSPA